ncbi:MAG: peptidylprolyl isomerase [Anaerolineales bacterium]|nr:peptidylprolyl isomerase [Anaerolineales bacterium]
MFKQQTDTRTGLRSLALFSILILTACKATPDTPAPTPAPVIETSAPPAATSVPMALVVNGEGIPQVAFDAEVTRFQDAQIGLGKTISPEEAIQRVREDLIDQLLLAQGAREAGYSLDEAALQSRIEALAEKIGGADSLSAWLADHGYTDETFRHSLQLAVESARMRDNIISTVPSTAEQVHVQQILLYNEETALEVQSRLNAGADFDELAAAYDAITTGELGWFPRGYLLEPQIEEAAFALAVGQVSDIIASGVGFHLIKVLERDKAHPLSPDALLALQDQALLNWLQEQRQQSTIE